MKVCCVKICLPLGISRRILLKEVVDQSDGCGANFSVVVVSNAFEGKHILQRHRLVNAVLEEELKTIHAFSQKTLTLEQWEKLKA
ncbi:hypothetical protein KM043_005507 [Ampulex compressa]|nr:hypothetical protein KM043_005507 [Ampulex compressa]